MWKEKKNTLIAPNHTLCVLVITVNKLKKNGIFLFYIKISQKDFACVYVMASDDVTIHSAFWFVKSEPE